MPPCYATVSPLFDLDMRMTVVVFVFVGKGIEE